MPKSISNNVKYYVYEHYEPDTGEVVYVGKGSLCRAWTFQTSRGSRRKEHYEWIINLINEGKTPDQFVRIIERNLSNADALVLEKQNRHKTNPRFNQNSGPKPKYKKQEIEELRQDGLSYKEIAEKLNIHKSTPWRILHPRKRSVLYV